MNWNSKMQWQPPYDERLPRATHHIKPHTAPSLDVDAHPKQQEQGAEPHEHRGHRGDQQLLEQLPGELAGGDLDREKVVISQ